MSEIDEAIRIEAVAVLDSIETDVVTFCEIFGEVARGEPLNPDRAENLTARCAELLRKVANIRNALRLSGDSPGVH